MEWLLKYKRTILGGGMVVASIVGVFVLKFFAQPPKPQASLAKQVSFVGTEYGLKRVADVAGGVVPNEQGVYIYANNEAFFYPLAALQSVGVVHGEIAGVSFLINPTLPENGMVVFSAAVSVPYRITTMSEALYEFPDLLIYAK